MNDLMRNRWVVGALAAVAVVLMVYQFWPKNTGLARPRKVATAKSSASDSRGSARGKSSTARSPVQASKGGRSARQTGTTLPWRPADRVYLAEHFDLWRDSPVRDPFAGSPPKPKTRAAREYPPAKQRLRIQAIWLQTGQKLALINNQLVVEGDRILDYTVQSIGADHVWVVGPMGREQVPFQFGAGASRTKRTSSQNRPSGSRSRR